MRSILLERAYLNVQIRKLRLVRQISHPVPLEAKRLATKCGLSPSTIFAPVLDANTEATTTSIARAVRLS